MIKIENVDIYGWEAAIRGMRNPMNSWDKSDSYVDMYGNFKVGPKDLKLMKTLANAGDDHGKFLRYIDVTFDITAPLYYFKEFDTYKISTVANSCSTMHKIHSKEFVIDDFSHEHLYSTMGESFEAIDCLEMTIDLLNKYRNMFLETDDKFFWWQMIQLLPSSYNQRRTVKLNYQVLRHMYHARKNHKLDEWHAFCAWVESLPYFAELIDSSN